MKVIQSIAEFKALRQSFGQDTVGFVPTMGALHLGHISLIETAKTQCAHTLASIFVNPTQFNNAGDFANYPKTLEADLQKLAAAGVDAVLVPNAEEIYADQSRFTLQESELTQVLCGPTRPGHFTGVLTVVMKLFGIASPTHAYFGEKDYQQLRLIQEMAKAFFMNVEVIGCPTLREADGLAMSSRNLLLTPEAREKAPLIYKLLTSSLSTQEIASKLAQAGFRVDYVEEHWGRRFVAAFLGQVRLIDNVAI